MQASTLPPRPNFDDQAYESLVRDGIAAARAGDRPEAQRYLRRAAEQRPLDPRPWLWLSATTDDPAEQRDFLEHALAADPNNSAARRGLVLLSDKLDKTRLLEQGAGATPHPGGEAVAAQSERTFTCPQCGGRQAYSAGPRQLTCTHCGYSSQLSGENVADTAEQVLDFTLPTSRAHLWAAATHRSLCEQCGATTWLVEGETAAECPYCGAGMVISSAELNELVSPQVVGPPGLDQNAAQHALREWLGKGWFVPDDLKRLARTSALRGAYYPFWTFDGTLELSWTAEVNEGSGDNPRWYPRNGVELKMFDDVLVSGTRLIEDRRVAQLEPFKLKDVVEYNPDYLAGWRALAYDISLADASLKARQKVAGELRRQLPGRVLIGREKRNLRSGGTNWSGMTYKHLLLPLWTAAYHYRGQEYRVIINGQTGKISGEKPRDQVKIAAIIISAVLSGVVIVLGLVLLALMLGWITI